MKDIKKLIQEMTLFEKVSLLSGEDFWRTRAIERLGIPQMSMADGPHGLRKQAEEGDHLGLVEGVKATCFPTSATVANSFDPELGQEIGVALGREAAHHHVNILLGPGLNIKRNPLCGRNFEYFSEDPYLSGKMAAAYVKGIQSQGVGACLKHFAANNQEHLRMTSDSILDDRTLREIYLTGFEIAVKEGQPKAVMSAYNKINGTYAHENKKLLHDILVKEWEFSGMVVSDWGGSNDPVEAVRAGAHLEMPSTGMDSVFQLLDAVENGRIGEEIINQRIEKYLEVLKEVSIKEEKSVNYEQHHQLAIKAAQKSAVLLENDGILPLIGKEKVAILGDFAENPRYQGAGSSMVNPYQLDSILTCIKDTELDVIGYEQGYERVGKIDEERIKAGVALAKRADVALIFVGLNEVEEVEGNDRKSMKISEQQIALLEEVTKVNGKVVAIISGGSVIEMPWVSSCNAVLHGYLSGQAGATALLNILTGKANPSGKLSETYPFSYESCPNQNYYPGKERTSEYREGLYVGYRYYDKSKVSVRYPFGYGLSYTSFHYANVSVDQVGVRFTISNMGKRAGEEVAQLYISKEQGAVHRPKMELKGFCKVHLEVNESKEVVIPFDEYSFRVFDSFDQQFKIEEGNYHILVGASSRDIRLQAEHKILSKDIIHHDAKELSSYHSGRVENISTEEFELLLAKPCPKSAWDSKQFLELNDSVSQMKYAKSALARFLIKLLISLRERSYKKGKPDLNLFFLSNMPFRAIAKMSNGNVSTPMVEQILVIVNGRFFKGSIGFIKEWTRYQRRKKSV